MATERHEVVDKEAFIGFMNGLGSHEYLHLVGEQYIAIDPSTEEGMRQRQLLAAAAIAQLMKVNDENGHGTMAFAAILHDLALALKTAAAGGRPPIFQPSGKQRGGHDSGARLFLKELAVTCLDILMLAGLKQQEASVKVAKRLSSEGHLGRKGGDVSAKSVIEWATEMEPIARARVAALARKIADVDDGVLSVADAETVVKWTIQSKPMRAKAATPR